MFTTARRALPVILAASAALYTASANAADADYFRGKTISLSIGYGFGAQIKRALAAVGRVEEVVLVAAILATVALLAWRLRRARRARHR